MNTFIISYNENAHGEYKKALGIKDKNTFKQFIKDIKMIDLDRMNSGLVNTGSCEKIAKTLECFNVEFKEGHPDMLIIRDLNSINEAVFSGDKTNLAVLLWITKEFTEEIADMIDENIRYDGMVDDNDFLCNVRDFFLNTYIKVDNYQLERISNKY